MIRRTFTIAAALLLCILPAACSSATSAPTAAVDHGAHGAGHSMPAADDETPYDAQFIDAMIVHHEGAVTMAEQALAEAERPELRALAEEILAAQQEEIGRMRDWRNTWYPDLPPTDGMQMEMGPMDVAAGTTPFEQRFIEAMIPHHEGAVMMAQDALQQAERQELRDLAAAIISAQESEITQMRDWLNDWYGIQP